MNTIRFEDLPTTEQDTLTRIWGRPLIGELITENELREARQRMLLDRWEEEQRQSMPS